VRRQRIARNQNSLGVQTNRRNEYRRRDVCGRELLARHPPYLDQLRRSIQWFTAASSKNYGPDASRDTPNSSAANREHPVSDPNADEPEQDDRKRVPEKNVTQIAHWAP